MAGKVSAAKPKTGGGLYVGATTATLPTSTDGTTTGFTSMGNVSDNGVENNMTKESEDFKAWGGDTVGSAQTSSEDSYALTLLDSTSVDVLKEVYGADNVTGTLSTGITIKKNAKEKVERAWIIDMVLADGILKRIVVPRGKITEIGTVAYRDNEPIGYEITIQAYPDASGNTGYEYIKEPSA